MKKQHLMIYLSLLYLDVTTLCILEVSTPKSNLHRLDLRQNIKMAEVKLKADQNKKREEVQQQKELQQIALTKAKALPENIRYNNLQKAAVKARENLDLNYKNNKIQEINNIFKVQDVKNVQELNLINHERENLDLHEQSNNSTKNVQLTNKLRNQYEGKELDMQPIMLEGKAKDYMNKGQQQISSMQKLAVQTRNALKDLTGKDGKILNTLFDIENLHDTEHIDAVNKTMNGIQDTQNLASKVKSQEQYQAHAKNLNLAQESKGKTFSQGQKTAVQIRNTIQNTTGIQNMGFIDSLAKTKNVNNVEQIEQVNTIINTANKYDLFKN